MQHDGSALSADEVAQLRHLEESLWRAETRFDRAWLERVLAPDFFESGRSGRVWDRAAILATAAGPLDALPLHDFAVHEVAAGVALVTYRSELRAAGGVEHGRRSSLWVRGRTGWRIRFHQGTPLATAEVAR